MKNNIFKKIIISLVTVMTLLTFTLNASAASKQAYIVTLDEVQDLSVSFSFDVEVVSISFIGPDETVYSESKGNLSVSTGDLWATYTIKNADEGDWSVEYDIGSNSSINYTVLENNLGITVSSFTVSSVSEDEITAKFNITSSSSSSFNYEIYAVNVNDESDIILLKSSSAKCNQDISQTVSLANVSNGEYYLELSATSDYSTVELFDSAQSSSFEYTNPNTPDSDSDYSVSVDKGNLTLSVNWENIYNSKYDSYQIVVINTSDDDTSIFDNELISSVSEVDITFPEDATELLVKFRYQYNNVWSLYSEKVISISDLEYLYFDDVDTTSSAQAVLNYSVVQDNTTIHIEVNDDQISDFSISGEGFLGITLTQGANTIYAYFIGENDIVYSVTKEIYYSFYPPEISLYENLDGLTVDASSINIMGKISNGTSLTVNDVEVELDEDSEFNYEFSLSEGENVIAIVATNSSGSSSAIAITVTRSSSLVLSTDSLLDYLPIILALLASIIIGILSLIFLKKKPDDQSKDKKKTKSKGIIIIWVIDALTLFAAVFCGAKYYSHYNFINSISFLQLAEKSITEASNYINMRDVYLYAGIGCAVAAVVIAVLAILVMKFKKNKANKPPKAPRTPPVKPIYPSNNQTPPKYKFDPQTGKPIVNNTSQQPQMQPKLQPQVQPQVQPQNTANNLNDNNTDSAPQPKFLIPEPNSFNDNSNSTQKNNS